MRNHALILIAIAAVAGTQDAYSTHISVPVLTTDEKLEYSFDGGLVIEGWVEYGGKPTSDVLLKGTVSDPDGSLVTQSFTTSNSDGTFEFLFGLAKDGIPGNYLVEVTSMCREEHRNICAYRTADATISVPESSDVGVQIPTWVKAVAEFWVNDQISDAGFTQAIEFLVHAGIISIPGLEESEPKSSLGVPDWIKTNAEFWIVGTVSDGKFAEALKWLASNGIIQI